MIRLVISEELAHDLSPSPKSATNFPCLAGQRHIITIPTKCVLEECLLWFCKAFHPGSKKSKAFLK